MSSESEIGIIIPTKGERPEFLRRALDYYQVHKIPVYIESDSSVNAHRAAYAAALRSAEPFLAWCGDDDIFAAPIIQRFARILPGLDCDAIAGRAILFSTINDAVFGCVENAIDHPDAYFHVFHREVLIKSLAASMYGKNALEQGALMAGWLRDKCTVYQVIDIHLFRQGHAGRYTAHRPKTVREKAGQYLPWLRYLSGSLPLDETITSSEAWIELQKAIKRQ